jgi:Leucine-rich repeat (LRR) protein
MKVANALATVLIAVLTAAVVVALETNHGEKRKESHNKRRNLRVMVLSGVHLSAEEFARMVGDMPFLRSLSLKDMETGDKFTEYLKSVSRLTQLEELDLTGCPVNDADLALLGGLFCLKKLNLRQTNVTGSALSSLPLSIKSLNLRDTGIDLLCLPRDLSVNIVEMGGTHTRTHTRTN